MYEVMVLVCCRGLDVLVPVPADAADRLTAMVPRLFVKLSIGSLALNGMLNAVAVGPPPSRRPKVWSRNWPNCQVNWVSRRCENTSWLPSLMMRLLMYRAFGPLTGRPMPSA